MNTNYSVKYNGNTVGEVNVTREGLYIHFSCRVKMPKDGIYRLQIWDEKGNTDLGILVPSDHYLELRKKIPQKQLSGTDFSFKVISNRDDESFIAVSEEQPFANIKELHLGKFTVRNGIAGVLLPSKANH